MNPSNTERLAAHNGAQSGTAAIGTLGESARQRMVQNLKATAPKPALVKKALLNSNGAEVTIR